jgi:hypothetical protein
VNITVTVAVDTSTPVTRAARSSSQMTAGDRMAVTANVVECGEERHLVGIVAPPDDRCASDADP